MTRIRKIIIFWLAVYSLFYLIESFIVITYPYEVSYTEGFILNQAYLISKGESIYKRIDEYPYLVANYPPLYPLLCAIFVKLFGISFIPGRLITFLSSIFVVGIIYKILKKETAKDIAIISALFFISSSYIFKSTPLFRIDMLGLFFSLLGLYIFIQTNRIFLPILCFLAALYTKPTFVSAPLALAIFLLLTEKKKGFIFIFLMSLSYATIFLLINHLTSGGFYKHTFLYNLNIFIFKQAIKQYILTLQNHTILILFSLFYLFYTFTEKKISILTIYFIISCIIAVSVGKIGSNLSYFYEMIALSCILTGLSLEKFKNGVNEKIYNYLSNAAILLQLIIFLHMPYLTEPSATRLSLKNSRRLSEIVAHTDGSILSEDGSLLIKNSKPILFQFFEFTQLANQKIWNQTEFVRDIKNRQFALIILSFDVNCFVDEERLTPEMAEAIRGNYYVVDKIGDYYLYKPIISN
uniref:Glycosyltransferase RgtA/B/C/D-like domain-containing protein n=1 Tax=candidate division WOR-3 bacterium TaxID=2052148 RepID=A0A7C4THN1_UNCW3